MHSKSGVNKKEIYGKISTVMRTWMKSSEVSCCTPLP